MAVKRRAKKARRATKARQRIKASKPRKAKRSARKVKRRTKKKIIGSKRRVWSGTAHCTRGGLTKKDLCVNKRGKIVSKRKFLLGKKAFQGIKGWLKALKQARKELGLTGFVACRRGTEYYRVAMKYYRKQKK